MERIFETWWDPWTRHHYGAGICEWCGARLNCGRTRQLADGELVLECGPCRRDTEAG